MSHLPVAVVADVPIYQAGLEAVLTAAGFTLEDPSDPVEWARSKGTRGERAAVLMVVGASTGFGHVEKLSHFRSLVVIALLRPVTPNLYLGAIAAGAMGAVAWSARGDELIRAIEAATDEQAIIPTAVLRHLARGFGLWLPNAEQAECLRRLATGETVACIGKALHYSEREMFRRLKGLYAGLGAAGRQDAVTRAIQLGLVEPPALRSGVA